MSRFVDLSHVVYDGMPGIRLKRRDGTVQEGTARIKTWLGREAMQDILEGQAAFEVTQLNLPTPIGTYIDSPFNRFPEGRDISELTLDELILPGVGIGSARARYWGSLCLRAPCRPTRTSKVPPCCLTSAGIGTGAHPRTTTIPISRPNLRPRPPNHGAKLLGFDTGNADGPGILAHPIHTDMLARDVLIVENLANLDRVLGRSFRSLRRSNQGARGRVDVSACVRRNLVIVPGLSP